MPRRLRFVFKITATIRSVPTANLNQFTSSRAITKPLSKNFNKKALYIYIREITDVETPIITKVTKILKKLYKKLYSEYAIIGHVKI